MPTRLRPRGGWRWGRCRGWGWGWGFSLIAGGVFFSGLWCFLALALLDQAVVAIVLIVYSWLFAVGGGRVSARRPTHFSLLRQRKVSQRKATHSLRPLRVATGQTCVGVFAGCAVELALRCARRSDNHGESVDEAWALRRPCSPRNRPAAGAASRGREPNIQTAGHPFGPSLRSAWPAQRVALAPARWGRAQRWPVWMSDSRVPFTMRRGAQWAGWHVCRRTHMLRGLTRRSCLNEAPKARSEFCDAPRPRAPQVAPARSAGDADSGVALSLVTFFRRRERKLLARRATPGLRP